MKAEQVIFETAQSAIVYMLKQVPNIEPPFIKNYVEAIGILYSMIEPDLEDPDETITDRSNEFKKMLDKFKFDNRFVEIKYGKD